MSFSLPPSSLSFSLSSHLLLLLPYSMSLPISPLLLSLTPLSPHFTSLCALTFFISDSVFTPLRFYLIVCHRHTAFIHTHAHTPGLPFRDAAGAPSAAQGLQISACELLVPAAVKGNSLCFFPSLPTHLYKLKTLIRLRLECQVWHWASDSIFLPRKRTEIAGKREGGWGEKEKKSPTKR